MSGPGTDSTGSAARLGTWLRDKYRLDRVLGEGGMATVYAATHRNKKRVAVKMLIPAFSMNKDIVARFLREGYVANTVEHPGAVAVLDDDVAEDGSAFLVMELLDGETVESLCERRGGSLDAPTALAIAYQLLDVLVAAHARGVVHRDIKPANLFVTRDGQVKVLDFGIARLREGDDTSSTRTGVYLGTPAFMSPEQANGRASQIDARSDVWSVGATLFFLLSGRNVHLGETAQHVVMLTATTQATPFASISPQTHAAVCAVVDRAVALDKTRRWDSAAAMRDAVADAYVALVGEPVSPRLLADGPTHPWPTMMSAGIMARAATAAASPFGADPEIKVPAVRAVSSAPSVSVTPARREAFATIDPVSSSPSPRPRRGRIAIGVTLAALVVAGGLYVGLARTTVSGAKPTARSSTAPQAVERTLPSATAEAPSATGPLAPATGVEPPAIPLPSSSREEVDAAAAAASVPARAPGHPRHAGPPTATPSIAPKPPAAPSATTPPPNPGVKDFDRQ